MITCFIKEKISYFILAHDVPINGWYRNLNNPYKIKFKYNLESVLMFINNRYLKIKIFFKVLSSKVTLAV